MGHAVRGDVAVTSSTYGWTAVMYHLHEFLATWLPANYDGRISIVASSPGSGGAWTEAGVVDNAYIVVQIADAWDDATVWQVVFAARDANSASTIDGVSGGVAIPNRGLWAGLSPKGGWNDTTKTFGSELFSGLRNVSGKDADSGGAGLAVDTVWNFGFMDRILDTGEIDNGAIFLHGKIAGVYTSSFLAGAFTPVNSNRDYPCLLAAGKATYIDNTSQYGNDTSAAVSAASIPAYDLSAFHGGYIDNSTALDGELLDEFSEYVGYPILWINVTLGRVVGWFDGLARIDIAVPAGSTFDTGMKWGALGLAWPWGVDNPVA